MGIISTSGEVALGVTQVIDMGYRTLTTLTQDVTNANAIANTLADVTGLSFPVVAGTSYRFSFLVNYTAAAITTGSRWTLAGPAFNTLSYKSRYTLTATSETINFASAYGTPSAANASSLLTGNLCIIEGTVTPSASGTVKLQFASEVLSSAITAKAGSTVEVW